MLSASRRFGNWCALPNLKKTALLFHQSGKRNSSHRQSTDIEQFSQRIRPHLPPAGQTMVDEGILNKINKRTFRFDDARIWDSLKSRCGNRHDMHELSVSIVLLIRYYSLVMRGCEKCLFIRRRCICDVVEKVTPQHDLWLFQHAKEIGRGNNSGSLLCHVVGAKRVIRGVQSEQNELFDHLERHSKSSMVLYPGKHALTIDEFMKMGRDDDSKMDDKSKRLSIVLLDGTPGQARNMERVMPPDIARVRLAMDNVSWLNDLRPQTGADRVCTAQAAALALRGLGDTASCDAIERVVRHVVQRSAI